MDDLQYGSPGVGTTKTYCTVYILTPVVVTSKVNDHLRPQSRSLDGPSFLVANQPGGGNVVVGNGLAESLMHSIGICLKLCMYLEYEYVVFSSRTAD